MTTFPKPKARPDNTPAWLKAARGYYGDAFETNKKDKLAESMADWCEMDADERGFVLAHLQYLNLLAQRGTQRLLLELRAMLEEVGDELIEAVEVAAAIDDEEDLDDADDDAPELAVVADDVEPEPAPSPTAEVIPLQVPEVSAGDDDDQPESQPDDVEPPEVS